MTISSAVTDSGRTGSHATQEVHSPLGLGVLARLSWATALAAVLWASTYWALG